MIAPAYEINRALNLQDDLRSHLSLADKMKIFIGENNLIEQGDKILLTISGGVDSTVMAYLFHEAGYDFGIAHCDFMLRGPESDEDEIFVMNLAKMLGRQIYIKRFDTTGFAVENKMSVQQAARRLRYDWFGQLCVEHGYTKIATAHHLDDSIETFYINLIRNSKPDDIRGIPVKNGKIIRPLLFTNRSGIMKYVDENFILYREDSSNESDAYLRNQVRHHIVPHLREQNANHDEIIIRLMQENTERHSFDLKVVEEWMNQNVIKENEFIYIPFSEEQESKKELENYLPLVLKIYNIHELKPEQIMNVKTQGRAYETKNYTVLRGRDHIIIRKKTDKKNESREIDSFPAGFKTSEMEFGFSVESRTQDIDLGEENVHYLDADLISLPLGVRTWKDGDWFVPLGMKGKKKLSDFYTDIGLERFHKDITCLLLSGNNIVCILGHRIDDRYKVTSETVNLLRIDYRKT